jgi:hypothetical protein
MLIAGVAVLLYGAGASAGGNPDDDQFAGEVLVKLVETLHHSPRADADLRGLLGSSIELAFLALERSDSPAAFRALARSAMLRVDAGGGQVRTAAIVRKGPAIESALARVIDEDYETICRGTMADVCMTRDDARRYITELRAGLADSSGRGAP